MLNTWLTVHWINSRVWPEGQPFHYDLAKKYQHSNTQGLRIFLLNFSYAPAIPLTLLITETAYFINIFIAKNLLFELVQLLSKRVFLKHSSRSCRSTQGAIILNCSNHQLIPCLLQIIFILSWRIILALVKKCHCNSH